MVVILIAWCLITTIIKGFQPVPWPTRGNLNFGSDALGWLKGTAAPQITFIAILIGLGHSLLAMSGEESLAQVNREIEAPKLKNLERAGFVIFLYSLLFTSLVSFFAVMLIPDGERARYLDNLIGGLSMFLAGPYGVRLLFHALVVLVGTLILAGAVNTAIIGSNGVLNRVAEDGVLPNFSRLPHLEKTLARTDTSKEDVVVVSVHLASPAGSGEHDLRKDQIFGPRETELFSKVVSVAEKAGKHVALLAIAGTNPWMAIVQTAIKLKSARIVVNYSPRFRNAGAQARAVEKQWERLPVPRFPLALEIVLEDSTKSQFHIFGQHPTQLWPEDFERIHKLWLEISEKEPGAEIRHRDVVSVALCRLDKDFHSDQGSEILNEIHREALKQKQSLQSGPEPSED